MGSLAYHAWYVQALGGGYRVRNIPTYSWASPIGDLERHFESY